jgi:hypothetical protein
LVDTIPPTKQSDTLASTDQHLHDNDCSEDIATASDSTLNASGNDDTGSHVNGIGNRDAYTRNVDTTSFGDPSVSNGDFTYDPRGSTSVHGASNGTRVYDPGGLDFGISTIGGATRDSAATATVS